VSKRRDAQGRRKGGGERAKRLKVVCAASVPPPGLFLAGEGSFDFALETGLTCDATPTRSAPRNTQAA